MFEAKKYCSSILALLALAAIAGCSTVDYYRLGQTRDDIDAAMTRYRNEVAFGGVSPGFQSDVTAAYQSYKTAFDAALQQAHGNYNAPTPPNVKQQADLVLSVLGSIPVVP
jgi:hypothetical protein